KKTGSAGIEFEEIPTSRTVSIVLDEQGDAWLGTLESGVHHLAAGEQPTSVEDQNAFNSYTARDGLSSDNVLAQLIDRDGTLWVGTNAGLDRLERKTPSHLALLGG